MKKSAIIMDIDGVLTYLVKVSSKQVSPTEYEQFYVRIPRDKPNLWAKELGNAMRDNGYQIILLTGRHQRTRKATEDWILDKMEWSSKDYILYMRPDENNQLDYKVKRDLYKKFIKPKYNILFVVEDRKSVVKMWRKNKLVVLQNSDGNY